MDYHVNEDIKTTDRVFPPQGRYEYCRLDMNENTDGLPREFVQSVLEEITPEFLTVYPEPDNFLKKYAKYVGVEYENLMVTNGSDMAIRYVLETFGERGKELVTVSPSFEMYRINCKILGMQHIPIEYEKDFTINIEHILQSISVNTRVVVLLNPNNPIGNVYIKNDVEKVIEHAREVGAVVIIDEAYYHFCGNSFMDYALEKDNVIVLRTFSKACALAACRLGIVISNSKVIEYLKRGKLTFDVNAIALLFAERLIEQPQIIEQLVEQEKEGKKYIIDEMLRNGYECRDCRGNYILLKPRNNPLWVEKELKRKGILIHAYSNNLLKEYIRVSVGSKKVMKHFADIFLKIDR